MILIVDRDGRGARADDLAQMYAHRKQVFIDQLGWALPARAHIEVDHYDRPDTLYLLAKTDPLGEVLASARLLPTDGPHLMQDIFAHTCDVRVPGGKHIWEGSRFCVNPCVATPRKRLQLLWEILAGIMEAALLYDKDYVTFTANRALLPLVMKCGWDARLLGPTIADGADQVTPVIAHITRDGLRAIRRRFQLTAPLIRCVTDERATAAA